MQNINRINTPEPVINSPLSAKRFSNTPHLDLLTPDSKKIFPGKNQHAAFTSQNKDYRAITFKKKQKEYSEQDNLLLERNGYSIFLVNSPTQRVKASKLIKCMYASRGYYTEAIPTSSNNPNQITFEASIKHDTVGTLTVIHDSKNGLLADTLYKEQLETIRLRNRKICELSKLAINPLYSSRELLASLFNLAYIHARIVHKATDFVIEVNPRHAGFYKRTLGFCQIGELRTCQRVRAPAVLLHLELAYVDAQVSCLAGTHDSKQRSIYTYFLTKYEEERIANKIQHKLIEGQSPYDRIRINASHPILV